MPKYVVRVDNDTPRPTRKQRVRCRLGMHEFKLAEIYETHGMVALYVCLWCDEIQAQRPPQ